MATQSTIANLNSSYVRGLQLGIGLSKAISIAGSAGAGALHTQQLPHNLTSDMIADAALAGIMLAAKSCGPPDDLSSGRCCPLSFSTSSPHAISWLQPVRHRVYVCFLLSSQAVSKAVHLHKMGLCRP